jgi:hypothetical protein
VADNVVADAGTGGSTFAAAELSFSGDTVIVPGSFVGVLSGSEGAWTFSLVVGGAGAVAAGVQRVTLASDDPAVASLAILDNVIYVDDADWTATTSSHALIGGVYQSTPGTITDGDTGPLRLTANGAAHVAVQNTVTVASHAVTNAGTFAVQAAQSGTWTVDLGATDNAVLDNIDADLTTIIGHVDGLEGLLTTIDGDTGTLAVVGNGAAATALRVSLANDSTGIIATVGTVTTCSTVTTVSTLTGGGVAHDSADSGNPHKIGAKAIAALSGATLVAAADRTDLYSGIDGVLITRPHTNLEDIVTGVAAITDGSSTSVIASAGAGVKIYITEVIIANSSASNVTVDLRDGAAGSVKATFSAPATGGSHKTLSVPLPFSAATAVCADPSAAASTVTVTLVGFKSKV